MSFECNTCKKGFERPYSEDDAPNDESVDLCPFCHSDDFKTVEYEVAVRALMDNGFTNQHLIS